MAEPESVAARPGAARPVAARPVAAQPAPSGASGLARRPGPADLAAASGKTIADVTGPGLRVLFCGINPGLYSAATGHHFARPGNRFWPALHWSGFTPGLLRPCDQDRLPELGLGITNVVARATARASELSDAELRAGGTLLAAKVARLRPDWLAVVGVTAYRTAFSQPKAAIGPQAATIGDTGLWVLPNPSGLNAHVTGPELAELMRELREALEE